MYILLKKIFLGLMISLFLFGCKTEYKKDNSLAIVEKENANFRVRVTAYEEERDFAQILAGAYYVFEVKTKEEQDWRGIMVYKHDDPLPINENSIKFVNENVAYVFMGGKYAVTTDAGKGWKFWDTNQNSLTKGLIGYNGIQNVELRESGEGRMQLKSIKDEQLITLYTKDYGISWNTKSL